MYIVNSISNAAGIAGTEFNRAIIENSSSLNVLSKIAIHEIGHNLSLRHTHNDNHNNLENPNGTEACSNGDYVLDTPPDPDLDQEVDNNCNYSNIVSGYNPLTNNYMSNSRLNCQDSFTEGQEDRMIYFINTESLLQNSLSQTCTAPILIGSTSICDDNEYTYTVENLNDGVDATWSINNLQYVSDTRNSITVKRINSNSGNAQVTVTVNNINLPKDIFLGKPENNLTTAITGSTGQEPVNGISTLFADNPTSQTYRWSIVTSNDECANNNGTYPTGTTFPGFFDGSGNYPSVYYSTSNQVHVRWGSCKGNYVVNIEAVNACGATGLDNQPIKIYDYYNGDPCPDALRASPNPSSNGEITVEKLPTNPCDLESTGGRNSNNVQTVAERDGVISNLVEVVNLYGQVIFSETFDTDIFEISGLQGHVGTFILKVSPLNEPMLTKILLLE